MADEAKKLRLGSVAHLGQGGVAEVNARTAGALGLIVILIGAAMAVPMAQPIEMGDYETYTRDRDNFDTYIGGSQIRFEAHLSSMLVRTADAWLGRTDGSCRFCRRGDENRRFGAGDTELGLRSSPAF